MKNQKVNGYVFITVTVIVTILVSTLTVAISSQNKSIELIQNYEKLRIIEEEISAIELVITEYLNNNLDENKFLTEISNFQEMFETPSGSNIKVKISSNDNCFNINSLFYKNSSNKLDVNNTELKRLNEIFKKLKIDTNIINNILDWIDTDKTNIKSINESLEYKKKNIDWLPRNNLAVSNIELTMIPEISAINSEVKEFLCVNLYNNKINILDMNPTKLSYFLPFLSEKNATDLSNIIRKDIWPNSKQKNYTEIYYLMKKQPGLSNKF